MADSLSPLKYHVYRASGQPDPPDTSYFVLRIGKDPDPHALPALLAYATSCANDKPGLAAQIRHYVEHGTFHDGRKRSS